jgi:glycerophosphoryl diester phosphodiesterase
LMSDLGWLIARPVAHRGLHDARAGLIENTPSAIAAATAAGYAIEVDLQVTAEGDAMVHHDAALGRLTQSGGALAALTVTELKRVAFKATTDRMITLGELCDLVAGRVALVLELKSLGDRDPRLPRRVAQVLKSYSGPTALMSFDPWPVGVLRELAPGWPRGLVATRQVRSAAWIKATITARFNFIAYAVVDLPAAVPGLARRWAGLPVLTWTVRTDAERRCAARFADQMIFEGFRP